MTDTTTQTETAYHACECSKWTAYTAEFDPETKPDAVMETGCSGTTKSRFNQGHDARLKSFLIMAGANGLEVGYQDGGLLETTDAMTAANRYGFGHQVSSGIANAQAKAARKAARAAAPKASRKAPKFSSVKVGRWQYPVVSAKVTGDQAEVTYTAKSGETKTVTVPVGNLS